MKESLPLFSSCQQTELSLKDPFFTEAVDPNLRGVEYLHELGDGVDLRRQNRSTFSHDLHAERHACVHCITFGVLHHFPRIDVTPPLPDIKV